MSEFKGCNKCKHVNKRPHEEPCVNCLHCAEEHFEPMTNADRIHNMPLEELAEWLSNTIYYCTSDKESIREWLQAEVGDAE